VSFGVFPLFHPCVNRILGECWRSLNGCLSCSGFHQSFSFLSGSENALNFIEIWINADILQGPTGKASDFNPDEFIDICQDFVPSAKLSLGYTSGSLPFWEGKFTKDHVDRMLGLCAKHNLRNVTFALNAALARNSPEAKRLVIPAEGHEEVRLYTLTLWGEADAQVKKWITSSLDPKRTFVDIRNPDSVLFSMKKGFQGVLAKRPWSMTILDDGLDDEEEQRDSPETHQPPRAVHDPPEKAFDVEGGDMIQ